MTVQKCGERARHCPMAGFVCNRASGTQDKVKWNLRHCPRGQRKMHPAARAVAQAPDSSGSSLTFFLPERKISPGRNLSLWQEKSVRTATGVWCLCHRSRSRVHFPLSSRAMTKIPFNFVLSPRGAITNEARHRAMPCSLATLLHSHAHLSTGKISKTSCKEKTVGLVSHPD